MNETEFRELTRKMRAAQVEYFASYKNKTLLNASKRLEERVDLELSDKTALALFS
tara:strand:- start:39 stop:203 length:165 start_codon:yes stop_codon:yes gene_type:complete